MLSRRQLLDAVWPDVTVGEEVLTHAIAELRKALGDSKRQPRYIETVHKSGYRLLTGQLLQEKASDERGQGSFPDGSEPSPATAVRLSRESLDPSRRGHGDGELVSHRPSIAVLPFDNLSGDPAQDDFADGLAQDLITELAREPDLFVIARTSSFAYKDSHKQAQEIGRVLGVSYVFEGSLQKAG